MARRARILVLPGDGVGTEVVPAAVRVLERVAARHRLALDLAEGRIGGASLDADGVPIRPAVLKQARASDAVLMGAVGGPRWDALPSHLRPEQALLALRKGLGAFANLRPARVVSCLAGASPLKREVVQGTDLLIVRELTGDLYYGTPRGIRKGRDPVGVNTMTYRASEIRRVARVAFDLARGRRRHVVSVDKANILETSQLWRSVVETVAKDYPDVRLDHLYVDNCAMQLIRDPRRFDVVLTGNLFGDILSDEAAMVTGSIGMLPSASIGGRTGLYEPVHGSAPDIAGKDRANPLATILTVAMLLRHSLALPAAALEIERAVEAVLEEGYRTADLAAGGGRLVGTREMAERVLDALGRPEGKG